ncbi:hypothetical protein AVEN_265058-1 [Araneus ventricosus]|uniref:Uncharacterized protein n=1 Tax=Araneus ventricosus TaxID=182803 RepID=A0A4Y2R3X2_ARAVE|nr:hypothetical protein AVEN_265058-1 [Araneus ventricosus]
MSADVILCWNGVRTSRRGGVKFLRSFFSFGDGIICFSWRVPFTLFLFVTSLKSVKSGEASSFFIDQGWRGKKWEVGHWADALPVESGGWGLE